MLQEKAQRLISYKINKISIKSIINKNRFVPLSSSPIQTILSVVESHHISLRSRTSFTKIFWINLGVAVEDNTTVYRDKTTTSKPK